MDPIEVTLKIRGTLTYTPALPIRDPGKYVIQRVGKGLGNVPGQPDNNLQVRLWTAGTNPNTTGQQTQRAKMTAAVSAWAALSAADKRQWRTAAVAHSLTGYNWFISQYLLGNVTPAGTTWDGGATTWDGGATLWDV
jgi:hypothetical protein